METAEQTAKRYAKMDRKKRAAAAYLKAMGFDGDFDSAAHQWLATRGDVISYYKPIRPDGSMNYGKMVDAIFEEIDNVDLDRSPKLSSAVQRAYRIYRGKTIGQGDDPEFDKTHSYDEGPGDNQNDAEALYTGTERERPISQKRWDELYAKAPNKSGIGSPRPTV